LRVLITLRPEHPRRRRRRRRPVSPVDGGDSIFLTNARVRVRSRVESDAIERSPVVSGDLSPVDGGDSIFLTNARVRVRSRVESDAIERSPVVSGDLSPLDHSIVRSTPHRATRANDARARGDESA